MSPFDPRLGLGRISGNLPPRAQGAQRLGTRADVAQLVAHHLAKVNVAGSSPVIRSAQVIGLAVEWPRGEARDCKSLYTGSNPVSTSLNSIWSIGAVG